MSAFNPASLAPTEDDSKSELCRKIHRMLWANSTGERGPEPQLDDDMRDSLYHIAMLFYNAAAGDADISFP